MKACEGHLRKDETLRSTHCCWDFTVAVARPSGQRAQVGRGQGRMKACEGHLRKDETLRSTHCCWDFTVAVARPSGQRAQVGRGPSGEADRSPASGAMQPHPPHHPSRLRAASPGGGLGFHPSLRLPSPAPASPRMWWQIRYCTDLSCPKQPS